MSDHSDKEIMDDWRRHVAGLGACATLTLGDAKTGPQIESNQSVAIRVLRELCNGLAVDPAVRLEAAKTLLDQS